MLVTNARDEDAVILDLPKEREQLEQMDKNYTSKFWVAQIESSKMWPFII